MGYLHDNYNYVLIHLTEYSQKYGVVLRIRSIGRLSKAELLSEDIYWKRFYRAFMEYLYKDARVYDNYAYTIIKKIRTFFNYLNQVKLLNIGMFHKNFYTRNVETPIIVLYPEQLNYLIYDKSLESVLTPTQLKVKDIFVFGCTVALRVSDLLTLKSSNLECVNDVMYLNVVSKKTSITTRIRLPQYAIDIIKKYKGKYRTILPKINNAQLNIRVKEVMELAGWTHIYIKTREVQGIPKVIYKNMDKKEHYRFCDLVSSHTMRRTGITTMLSLGMPEQAVRRISGHSPHSKEFYRYVAYSQSYLDKETDKVFKKLYKKTIKTS